VLTDTSDFWYRIVRQQALPSWGAIRYHGRSWVGSTTVHTGRGWGRLFTTVSTVTYRPIDFSNQVDDFNVIAKPDLLNFLHQLYFRLVHSRYPLPIQQGSFLFQLSRSQQSILLSVIVEAICTIVCHLHSFTNVLDVDVTNLSTNSEQVFKLLYHLLTRQSWQVFKPLL